MGSCVSGLAYALPERCLTNEELAAQLGGWTPARIFRQTGVRQRWVAEEGQCASDLAVAAVHRLFEHRALAPGDVDFLFYVTQSPDYPLPASACLMQDRLGLPRSVAALDINLGCSGFVYALAAAHGWIAAGLGRRGLVLAGDTSHRSIRPTDSGTRVLFSDAGAAAVVEECADGMGAGSFVFGTDGSGAERLIVRHGGSRHPCVAPDGCHRPELFMDGAAIFVFSLEVVPELLRRCAELSGHALAEVDCFLLHQANAFVLKHLRDKMNLAPDKLPIRMEQYGNTSSASVPMLMADLVADGTLQPGMRIVLAGFGVGLSWAACELRLGPDPILSVPDEKCQR